MKIKLAILTVSDKASRGERVDEGGPLIREILEKSLEISHISYEIVPDEEKEIVERLNRWIKEGFDLIVTTGGTGPSPRDVTPEATSKVIEKRFQGLEILMLLEGLKIRPEAAFSRGIVGSKNGTLIINLPGNPRAIRENFPVLIPLIPHLLLEIKGLKGEHESH